MREKPELVIFGTRKYSALIVTALVIAANYLLYVNVGFVPMLIIGGSGALALVVWLKTTYHHPVDFRRVLPLYLLLIATELIHMTEEYVTNFPQEVSKLTGATMTQDIFVVAFVMIGTTLALLSAYGLQYRNPMANYFLWFIIIGPGFVNGIAHVMFPIMAQTYYFPGLVTVVFPVIVGIILAARLYNDVQVEKQSAIT